MTDERLQFIARCCVPHDSSPYHRYMKELIREVKRARQSEKICRAAASYYKHRYEPVLLKRYA